MTYTDLLSVLNALADEKYRAFQTKLLKNGKLHVIGVRVPDLRKIARTHRGELETFLSFPDDDYEVTFLKCLVLALQPYRVFRERLPEVLPLIDNWAACDCFDAPVTEKTKGDFLSFLLENRFSAHEFTSRYCLVQLLRFYCEPQYFPVVFDSIEGCDHTKYYVSMAAAWLLSEVIVKDHAAGVGFLKKNTLPSATKRRAIQKAKDSFRLTKEQKNALELLK